MKCPKCQKDMIKQSKPWVGNLANAESKSGQPTNWWICKNCGYEEFIKA